MIDRPPLSKLYGLCRWLAFLLCVSTWGGCGAPQSLTEQQVDELLKIPSESAQATRQLVEHDAKSREQWLELHCSIQAELAEIGRRQEELEAQRQRLARQQQIVPVLAASIELFGWLLLCSLPSLAMIMLLWPRKHDASDELCEFLVNTVAEQQQQVKRMETRRK